MLTVIFHINARRELQTEIKALKQKQMAERSQLAKRIHEFRLFQERENKRSIRSVFEQSQGRQEQEREKRPDRSRMKTRKSAPRTRNRTLE